MEKAKEVKPIAVKNGTKIVGSQDASAAMAGELIDPSEDLGQRELNADGSIARSRVLIAQISENRYYDNRYKIQGTKGTGYNEIWLVPAIDIKGFRAVVSGMEDKNIPVYILSKTTEEPHNFYLKGKTTVDYQKFHSEFTHKLNKESMQKILPLLTLESDDVTNDDIENLI